MMTERMQIKKECWDVEIARIVNSAKIRWNNNCLHLWWIRTANMNAKNAVLMGLEKQHFRSLSYTLLATLA